MVRQRCCRACSSGWRRLSWRTIDLISDLHLCEAMPRTFDAFRTYLQSTKADAVFVLGDLFEVWVGDDVRHRPFESACVDVLAEAASQRCVAFLVATATSWSAARCCAHRA
jgi:UDP-2,3-diacylglucosamine hydrolase